KAAGFSGNSVDLTDIVRLAPDAQGKQTAPQLIPGKKAQQAPDMQVRLPIRSEATAHREGKIYATWQPGDVLVVALPAGVTFAKAPTVKASELVDVASGAGFGTQTTATVTTDSGAEIALTAPQTSVTLSSDGSAARILISNSLWGGVP